MHCHTKISGSPVPVEFHGRHKQDIIRLVREGSTEFLITKDISKDRGTDTIIARLVAMIQGGELRIQDADTKEWYSSFSDARGTVDRKLGLGKISTRNTFDRVTDANGRTLRSLGI